jgi:hypothetical protein
MVYTIALIHHEILGVYFYPQGGQKISFTPAHPPLSSSRIIPHTRFFRGARLFIFSSFFLSEVLFEYPEELLSSFFYPY